MSRVKANGTFLSRLVPFGLISQTKPRHYREIFGVLWDNKSELPYAWNVLNHGVCDGCSLGPYGLKDNVLDGVHLCMTRLKLLKLNTMAALDPSVLRDVNRLRGMAPEKLRSLGRLPYPMIRRQGERGFLRVSWDEALEVVCHGIRRVTPHEMGFFATSRGLTNEVYYVFQKLARVLGTNNVNICSRPCHMASVSGLKATLGVGAPTCSLSDFIGTDLLAIFGSDLANKQPVTAKYMHYAKSVGTRVAVVNAVAEYGLERDWVPSVASSAPFGAKIMDDFFQVRVGGDIAFVNGVLKFLIAADRADRPFIEQHTSGFAEMKAALDRQSWEMLEQRSGVVREAMQRFAETYSQARTAVFVYSMGDGQHEFDAEHLKALVNLALARGMLGRVKCGIMPIGGHSGLPGAGECGIEPDRFPGGFAVNDDTARRFSNLWHHPVPSNPGLKVPHLLESAHRGGIKFLYALGANPLATMPNPSFVADALAKVTLRVHQGIVLNISMLLDCEEAVVLLPGQTRYEQRNGGTSTSTERRIRFTPEIPGHRIGEALPEWEIPVLIGRKSMSNGDKLFPFDNTQAIREEMSRVIPIYQGIEKLTKEGDQMQWGGPYLFKDGFTAMANNRALFTVLDPSDQRAADGILTGAI